MSTQVKFSLKRKAVDPPATTAVALASGAFEELKKARTEAEQTEGVAELVDGSVVGTEPAAPKGPLVIALKLHNEWQGPVRTETVDETLAARKAPASNPPAPRNALLLEARSGTKWGLQLRSKAAKHENNNSAADTNTNNNSSNADPVDTRSLQERAIDALLSDATAEKPAVVPILQQNAVPGIRDIADPKEKYKYDMSLRPDEATLEDFEAVPIEDFGLAMLRGMGYKEDTTKKDDQAFVFNKPRPNLLGLGAEPPKKESATAKDKTTSSSNSKSKSESERSSNGNSKKSSKEEKYAAGRRVKILKDCKWRGEVGSILSCRVKSDGIALKIGVGRDEMRCWSDDVQLV
ncbi:DExH-box splicing factor binding site-domain-containing protein [Obelidium mucronatum]|nr:DExH-box splicing factor binding site-domain-containing protein [Obelidium mucronatum]